VLRIGRIARPHGIRGAVAITLDDPDSESLFGVRHVHLAAKGDAPRRVAVLRSSPGRKGQVLLHLEGLTTPEAAEALRDQELFLEEDQLPKLGQGEYWERDLLKLTAFNEAGAELGPVAEVVDTADVPVLVVRAQSGEVFVPFTDPYVLSVDVTSGKVVVAPPEMAE
jgi:16S rRNA processing protein RimM